MKGLQFEEHEAVPRNRKMFFFLSFRLPDLTSNKTKQNKHFTYIPHTKIYNDLSTMAEENAIENRYI